MSTTKKSDFAIALENLLDETGLFTRREWAEVLGVSQPAISYWVNDKTIPRADNLSIIVTTLEQSSGVPPEPLAAFREMAQRRATDVSPHGKRMLPTVAEYMARPGFSELSSELAKLPPADQEKLLEKQFPPGTKAAVLQERVGTESAGTGQTQGAPAMSKAQAQGVSLGGAATVHVVPAALTPFVTPTFRLDKEDKPGEPNEPSLGWEEVAQRTRHVVLSGPPGSGKTCFLLHLSRALKEKAEWASRPWPGRVPAYVAMHRLPPIETAEELWLAVGGVGSDVPRERIVLLLDGFDEVPIERRACLSQAIIGLRDRDPRTAIVVTSRPTPDVRALGGMTRFALEKLSDTRLLMLAYNRASSAAADSERWGDVLVQVGACFRERPDVLRALGNPLMVSYAASFFAKRWVVACRDSDLIDSCLTFLFERWDEEKQVSRPRSAWMSVSSNALYQWLGGLCYQSLIHGASKFTREDIAGWFKEALEKTPVEADLKAIAESTGVIEPVGERYWKIAQQPIREYLAARYVVESSRDATAYLRRPAGESWVSSVLRFACSITHDATPLLSFVLDSPWGSRADKMTTLADMVAQQLRASEEVLAKSCDTLVGLLEESLSDWRVATSEEQSEVFPEPKWRLAARRNQSTTAGAAGPGRQVLQTIKAVHRARLSPARQLLSRRLAASANEVVRDFGASLAVEGYMEGRSFTRGDDDLFAAEVCEI